MSGMNAIERSPDERRHVMHVLLNLAIGGAERLVYEWVQRLDRERYRQSVCLLNYLGTLGEQLRAQGVEVHVLDVPPGLKWATVRRLKSLFTERRVDVIHAHTYTPFFFAALARPADARLVFTEHGRSYPEVKNPKRRLVNPWLARRADAVVTISEATRRSMIEIDRLPADRIEVIWNGVAFAEGGTVDRDAVRRELGVDPSAPLVGMASRIVALKNFPMALRAFRRVHERIPEARLVIAGDGDYMPQLRAEIERLGLGDSVLTLGFRDDLERLLPCFDLLLLSSRTEGISVTLLESMAHGVPAVVTAVGGNPEVVEDGVTGRLVPSDDDAAMAEAVLAYLEDDDLRLESGRRAAERARREFSFETMLERYTALYDGEG